MRGTSTEKDKRIAQVIHAYKKVIEARTGPVEIKYPGTRVITVDRMIKAGNQVHTFQQVEGYIEKNEIISVGTCY